METWIVLCVESTHAKHLTPTMCFCNNEDWGYGLFHSKEEAKKAADWLTGTYSTGVYVVARYKLDEAIDVV